MRYILLPHIYLVAYSESYEPVKVMLRFLWLYPWVQRTDVWKDVRLSFVSSSSVVYRMCATCEPILIKLCYGKILAIALGKFFHVLYIYFRGGSLIKHKIMILPKSALWTLIKFYPSKTQLSQSLHSLWTL